MEKKNNNNMNMTIEEKEKCGFLKLFVLLFSGISQHTLFLDGCHLEAKIFRLLCLWKRGGQL